MRGALVLAAAILSTTPVGAQSIIVGRLSSEAPLSREQLAELEARVNANPSDKQSRVRLLRQYFDQAFPGGVRSPFRAARLTHILYLIENDPADPICAGPLADVPSTEGPFADPADHIRAHDAWLRTAERSIDTNVLVNAAHFLHREHPDEAEQLLGRVLEREPANRRVGADLGFYYALDMLNLTSADLRPGARSPAEQERLSMNARSALQASSNIFVLAGAATGLQNLFVRTPQGRSPDGGRAFYELAAGLMTRARALDGGEVALRGPMPLVPEFQQFLEIETAGERRQGSFPPPGSAAAGTTSETTPPGVIRVGAAVQAEKLIDKPKPVYPPEAMKARIQGAVRFEAVIGTDGRIENLTLQSGHPLLVPAATQVVRRYQYRPTLLNGTPVKVLTQVDVPFLLSE
jgi:TonB family protein